MEGSEAPGVGVLVLLPDVEGSRAPSEEFWSDRCSFTSPCQLATKNSGEFIYYVKTCIELVI